jgi:hypothetical protein
MGSRTAAEAVVEKKLGAYADYAKSVYWPHAYVNWVRDDLLARIDNPDLIWQSCTNTCGIATFINALAWDDPYLYAYFVSELVVSGAAYLGYGGDARVIKASKLTRSSKIPFEMSHADWVGIASIRDYLNDVLHYSYNMGVPVLKDIPLLGFLGTPNLVEAVGGITWPSDLETILKSVGYTKVVNEADATAMPSPETVGAANSYLAKEYRVLILIHTNLLHDNGGSVDHSSFPNHWVRLTGKFELKAHHFKSDKENGIRFKIRDTASGMHVEVPTSGGYLRHSGFMDNFYGYIAGTH